MRTFLATMASVAVLSTSAMAADLGHNPSTKDYGYDGVATNHTGFYFGAGAGYGTSVISVDGAYTVDGRVVDSGGLDIGANGGVGTIQIGYDKQLGQNFLIGAFADYSFYGVSGTGYIDDASVEWNVDSGWTVGLRTGVVHKETLFYIMGGWGQTRWSWDASFTVPTGFETSGDANTWVAGGGIETKIAPGLFLGVEGRARFIESHDIYNVTDAETDENIRLSIDPTVYTGMVTLKYKLGSQ